MKFFNCKHQLRRHLETIGSAGGTKDNLFKLNLEQKIITLCETCRSVLVNNKRIPWGIVRGVQMVVTTGLTTDSQGNLKGKRVEIERSHIMHSTLRTTTFDGKMIPAGEEDDER